MIGIKNQIEHISTGDFVTCENMPNMMLVTVFLTGIICIYLQKFLSLTVAFYDCYTVANVTTY